VSSSFLVIQTAFIGDVILATALVEKLHATYPDASIDFLLRQGNETLLAGHPHVREVIVWNKKKGKIKNLFKLIGRVRSKRYDYVINVHRFASSGMITAFSGAKEKIGFDKNPWSFAFTRKVKHQLDAGLHEVDRNQKLIDHITNTGRSLPKLYPSVQDVESVSKYKTGSYLCIAPTSVWFTKQFPAAQWIDFLRTQVNSVDAIYLLGAPNDRNLCDEIKMQVQTERVINLAGQLSFLQSAALIQGALMNYVNDSAPMHIASSMNAPVAAVYCSTVPAFGFGPLSERSFIVETSEKLECRPCGLHGYKACPLAHFHCATTITTQALQNCLER